MKKRITAVLFFSMLYGVAMSQKGEKSLSAGPLVLFPLTKFHASSGAKTGIGLGINGQYNFSNSSAVILQSTLSTFKLTYDPGRFTILWLKAGYRYQFTSGIFVHGLTGVEIELDDGFTAIAFTIGAGKRFIIREKRFIDVGLNFTDGDSPFRTLNIKAACSLFRK